ncbi:Vps5 C terminal like-domain-containing protein [Lipomyces chichibuensis]|uniref:Vps5 C terminal like-domain-containing protein n=1 Tax=Lipomyces chichibuensis TaxID=1546026 RepID=UPI003343FD1D
MDADDLGASQWDDVATPRPVAAPVSPTASPPLDSNPFSPPPITESVPDELLSAEPEEKNAPAEDGQLQPETSPSKKQSTASYATVSAAASRARALRMARSRKSSLPAGAVAPEALTPETLAHSVVFEDIDPVANPLGPLENDHPPEERKEEVNGGIEIPSEWSNERGIQSAAESAAAAAAAAANPNLSWNQPTTSSGSGQKHIPVEQAANPTFDISVGDPIKVGELTSAHTVYNVRTRTTSKAFRYFDFTVTRRYRDFRWLYHQLSNNNPGIIVPAPPEKQAVGRFDESFVEGRRAALEKMLNKIAHHPVLQHDPDLKMFLETDALNSEIKVRERLTVAQNEAKGGGGIMGTLGGAFQFNGKFVEVDEWFVDKRAYIEALDLQLKALSRALDTVIVQRKELADTTSDFANALTLLGEVELSRPLATAINGLADVEQRIRDLHERQGLQDMLTLGDTIDEYVRLIDSIKTVFSQRQKSYLSWQTAEQELTKKQQYLARVMRQGKTPPERLASMQEEVAEYERRVYSLRIGYDDICKTIKSEFEKFQKEKIEDFRSSVETYLESAVESQKEAIEMWETFYERQGFGTPEPQQA